MTTPRRPATQKQARLRILATTDLHMQLTGYDYAADKMLPAGGASRIAPLIAKARAEAGDTPVLLLDNGDSTQGAPLGDFAALTPDTHPMIQIFKHLDYDAIGLGNHDFDFGLETQARVFANAPGPVLCSNVTLKDTTPVFQRDAILEIAGEAPLRVGLFSCLPPQTMQWNAQILAGRATIDDIVQTARVMQQRLRDQGADIVVMLCHSGPSDQPETEGIEQAAHIIATLPGIDAIVAGHSHRALAETENTPMIQPGAFASHLGVMDLTLQHDPEAGWRVSDAQTELRPAGTVDDPEITALVQPIHTAIRAKLTAQVGTTKTALHSYFCFFGPERGLDLLARAQAAVLTKMLGQPDLPILSAVAPMRFGGRNGPHHFTDVPAGPVEERHIFDLCVFENALCALRITGAQALDWLEMSAGRFNQIPLGSQGNDLLDPDFPGHNFDMLYGLTYQIDLTQPARFDPDGNLINPDHTRIKNATWNGAALDPAQEFIVALSSYRMQGGGNIPTLRDAHALDLPGKSLRSILREAIGGACPEGPQWSRPWSFAALPDTAVVVETGPGAQSYLKELSGTGITPLGLDKDGFLRLHVPLHGSPFI